MLGDHILTSEQDHTMINLMEVHPSMNLGSQLRDEVLEHF